MYNDFKSQLTNENLGAYQKVAGYSTNNLFNNNVFITRQISKKTSLSFKIYDIEITNSMEILKISFNNDLVARLMKFTDEHDRACATFDLVDESKKIILLKTTKIFIGAIGISDIFYAMNYITQWEIPIFTKLCRGFIFGDKDCIRGLITKYNLKIEDKNEYRLKDHLGLAQI